MTADPIITTEPSATRGDASVLSTLGKRVKRAIELRAGRLRIFLLVITLLLPLLLTSMFGDG
jgi:hypothetical protein